MPARPGGPRGRPGLVVGTVVAVVPLPLVPDLAESLVGSGAVPRPNDPPPHRAMAIPGTAGPAHPIAWGRPSNSSLAWANATNGSDGWFGPNRSTDPPARWNASLADDPALGGVVLFGGLDAAGADRNDTWWFGGGTWTELCSGGSSAPTCPASPPAMEQAELAYDPAFGGLVLFGDREGSVFHTRTWLFVQRT